MNFSIERRAAAAAVVVAGALFAGCDRTVKPDFDTCAFNRSNESNTYYLRENALHENTRLTIGDFTFTRDPKDGSLLETVGDEQKILQPGVEIVLPVQNDGRIYELNFSDRKIYIQADVDTYCPLQKPTPAQ